MKKLLIVVDMQNDFIDGSLGSPEAKTIVPNVVNKIKNVPKNSDIIFTKDTHYEDYLDTQEGKMLPVKHCIRETYGWSINNSVNEVIPDSWLEYSGKETMTVVEKYTFGSTLIPEMVRHKHYDEIELVGLCTDICVVSNALILKANFPETEIIVDASCCAGATPEKHKAALEVMKSCQIKVIGE